MERTTYVRGVVDALNAMAQRMSNAAPPFAPDSIPAERAEAVRQWRRSLVNQVRDTAVADIERLEPPEDLREFHQDLVQSIRQPGSEDGLPRWHGAPQTEGWPRLMMRLAMMCQEADVPFPTSVRGQGQPAEPEPERVPGGDWRTKLRRELELRGHPDPQEAIDELEELRSRDPGDEEDA